MPAARRRPNDASGVVWALGKYSFVFFFDSNLCFIVNIGCNLRNSRREES